MIFSKYFQAFRHVWFGSEKSILAWLFFIIPFIQGFFFEDRFYFALICVPAMFLLIPVMVLMIERYY